MVAESPHPRRCQDGIIWGVLSFPQRMLGLSRAAGGRCWLFRSMGLANLIDTCFYWCLANSAWLRCRVFGKGLSPGCGSEQIQSRLSVVHFWSSHGFTLCSFYLPPLFLLEQSHSEQIWSSPFL